MRSWRRCLAAAGVRGEAVRADYSAAARYLQRKESGSWILHRVLVPPEGQPHTVVTTALVRHTDDLSDSGPVEGRIQRFDEWAAQVQSALDTGSSGHPLLRAYLHSADRLNLSRKWVDAYVAGSRTDLEFAGFANEADYQRYIDIVDLPVFMFTSGAVPRLVSDERYTSSARYVADGMQRADVLGDMFEDLQNGRFNLPMSDLDQYGVTRADLSDGLDTPAVRALISATANSARAALGEGERLLSEIGPDYRPAFRCVIEGLHMRLDDIEAQPAAIIRRPYRDRSVAWMRLMIRSRRARASTSPIRRQRSNPAARAS